MKYLQYKFSNMLHEDQEEMSLDTKGICMKGSFKYTGSIIQGNIENNEDTPLLLSTEWIKMEACIQSPM